MVKYLSDSVYGDSQAENHPLMQQYYLMEFEWASACEQVIIESKMLTKYINVVDKNNKVTQAASE